MKVRTNFALVELTCEVQVLNTTQDGERLRLNLE